MNNCHRPTAAEVARLTVYLVSDYDREKHKSTSRFRISSKSLRRMAGRINLRDAFIEEWENDLYELNWNVLRVGDYFGLIRADNISEWARISSVRIKTMVERVRNEDLKVWDEIEASIETRDAGDDSDED